MLSQFKSFALFTAALIALGGVDAAQAESKFFSALPDVPMASGLTELTDSVVIFDKASGRLVDFAAKGAGDCAAPMAFYQQSLPALGWVKLSSGYLREAELLNIHAEVDDAGECLLTFSLRPQGN